MISVLIVVHIYHSPRYWGTEGDLTFRAHMLIDWKSGCYSLLLLLLLLIWRKQATNCCFDPDSFKFDQLLLLFFLFFPFSEINETRSFLSISCSFTPCAPEAAVTCQLKQVGRQQSGTLKAFSNSHRINWACQFWLRIFDAGHWTGPGESTAKLQKKPVRSLRLQANHPSF